LQNSSEGVKISIYFSIIKELVPKAKLFFNPFFNGFHSSTLVQVIANKSADLGLFFFSNKIWWSQKLEFI
jgi:hypothetical protein